MLENCLLSWGKDWRYRGVVKISDIRKPTQTYSEPFEIFSFLSWWAVPRLDDGGKGQWGYGITSTFKHLWLYGLPSLKSRTKTSHPPGWIGEDGLHEVPGLLTTCCLWRERVVLASDVSHCANGTLGEERCVAIESKRQAREENGEGSAVEAYNVTYRGHVSPDQSLQLNSALRMC